MCFNPRPCARGDLREVSELAVHRLSFNPRPCARGDEPVAVSQRRRPSFNPRPCARGDGAVVSAGVSGQRVSIRAPARGATGGTTAACGGEYEGVSIRAPERGATCSPGI